MSKQIELWKAQEGMAGGILYFMNAEYQDIPPLHTDYDCYPYSFLDFDLDFVADKTFELALQDIFVYAAIHSQTSFGEIYSFLIVPKHAEDWQYLCQKIDNDTYRVYAYCENVTHPECSESGYIVVKGHRR